MSHNPIHNGGGVATGSGTGKVNVVQGMGNHRVRNGVHKVRAWPTGTWDNVVQWGLTVSGGTMSIIKYLEGQ